jgi:hypothetical protein
MKRFTCSGFQSVQFSEDGDPQKTAMTAKNAAHIFAGRLARKEFGKKGECGGVTQTGWSFDGKSATFDCRIGVRAGKNFSFRNEQLTVAVDE